MEMEQAIKHAVLGIARILQFNNSKSDDAASTATSASSASSSDRVSERDKLVKGVAVLQQCHQCLEAMDMARYHKYMARYHTIYYLQRHAGTTVY
jgi:hypothetical protein